jgi:hypothetical protein
MLKSGSDGKGYFSTIKKECFGFDGRTISIAKSAVILKDIKQLLEVACMSLLVRYGPTVKSSSNHKTRQMKQMKERMKKQLLWGGGGKKPFTHS